MSQYKHIRIGGSDFRLPVVENKLAPNDAVAFNGASTPEWMVSMDSDLKSSISGYDSYSELYGWYGQSGRFTSGDISNRLFTSASLKHSSLVIQIPNGDYAATLETKMNNGTHYDKITIVRLGNIESACVILQQIDFGICRIQSMAQELDRLNIELIVTTKSNTIFVYDNTGANTGQTVSQVDYSQNTSQ